MSSDGFEDKDIAEGIAIVGMSGRFPGADSVDQFWRNLIQGVCSIDTFTDEALRQSGVPETLLNNPKYVKKGGVLKGPELFDAAFFGYSPREAQSIDPQQRLFLEGAWGALENAGYDPGSFEGDIGVYAGCGMNYYLLKNLLSTGPDMESVVTAMNFFGNDKDFLATRVSYKLNLTGPSIDVQTACSTSLVAVQLACQGLFTYQCDMALAGGVSIQAPRMKGYLYAEGEIFSTDGYCRTFDKKATGTVFGEGYGIVVLKRLEDALKDMDNIYAVIQGIAVNNDGSDKVGYTAPSVNGQKAVIAMAQALADVTSEEISYIEAHGTGTQMGDPMELAALTQVFRETTQKRNFCAIGSAKPNVGHMDVAAGVASLIKVALALKHRQIPPRILFDEENPELNLKTSPFYVNTKLSDWKPLGTLRRAGISSFGIGGTNAHAVLSEAPHIDTRSITLKPFVLLPLSARSPGALQKMTSNLQGHLEDNPNLNLSDAAYTLQTGRRHFQHRRAVVCEDVQTAIHHLASLDSQTIVNGVNCSGAKEIVFMFTGQGSQYVKMADELYRKLPAFKETVDTGSEILEPLLHMDIRDVLFPEKADEERASRILSQTAITQPALFLVEMALAKLMIVWGIRPWAMIGHSIGEYVAACLANVFSFEDALKVVAERGRLMQAQEHGDMLAVMMAEEELKPLVGSKLSIAAVNSPSQCVVSGDRNAIDSFQKALSALSEETGKKIRSVKLNTSHAFHSSMMEPAVAPFRKILATISMSVPEIPFISNTTGDWIDAEQASNLDYWADHIRHGVRFSDGVRKLIQNPKKILLEIGPGSTLISLAKPHCGQNVQTTILPSMRRTDQNESDFAFLLKTLGKLWIEGVNVDWAAYHADETRMRVSLPTYPFERKRIWIDRIAKNEIRDESQEALHREDEGTIRLEGSEKPTDSLRPECKQPSDVEKNLTHIWKKILGYKHIDPDENYFELGGNSLMAVSLFDRIEQLFCVRLPLATLYDAPTIRQLAEILKSEDYEPSWNSLVAINKSGSKPPLFFVHAEGGNVLEYRTMATRLGADQPFYGLQAQGLKGDEIIVQSIERMAADYLKEIKTVQPEGPYYIGGYCLGGLVSYEMAQQLMRNGEEVGSLILISTSTPDQLRNVKPGMKGLKRLFARVLERIELEVDNFSKLSPKGRKFYILDRIKRSHLRTQIRIEGKLDNLFSFLGLNFRLHSRSYILQTSVDHSNEAFGAYDPKPYPESFHLFRVTRCQWERQLNFEPLLGWEGLTEKPIHIDEVEGFHQNILKEPYAFALASKIWDIVKDAQTSNE